MRTAVPLVVLAVTVAAVVVAVTAGRGLTRGRLDRFARRHRLVVTTTNGPHVVRALVVSRRWRRFGVVVALLVAAGVALTQRRFTIDLIAMFLGWFAGAAVAEWRISPPVHPSAVRRASLTARELSSYVTPMTRAVSSAVGVLLVGCLSAAGLVAVASDQPGDLWRWLGWVVVTALAAGALWATMRRVVGRPQPASSPDLVAADDALRGQSLTVLVGCAVAAAALPIGQLVPHVGVSLGREAGATIIATMAFVVLMVAGWLVASVGETARARSLRLAGSGAVSPPAGQVPPASSRRS